MLAIFDIWWGGEGFGDSLAGRRVCEKGRLAEAEACALYSAAVSYAWYAADVKARAPGAVQEKECEAGVELLLKSLCDLGATSPSMLRAQGARVSQRRTGAWRVVCFPPCCPRCPRCPCRHLRVSSCFACAPAESGNM